LGILNWLQTHGILAGVWTIASVAIVTLIKTWPTLKKLAMDENALLRADRRADYKELRREVDIMKLRSEIVERHSTAVDVRMGQLEFIIGMVLDELESESPGNAVAKKAREMFGRLYPVPPITDELEALKKKLDPIHSPIGPQPHVPSD
jgi:hypothetical protein